MSSLNCAPEFVRKKMPLLSNPHKENCWKKPDTEMEQSLMAAPLWKYMAENKR